MPQDARGATHSLGGPSKTVTAGAEPFPHANSAAPAGPFSANASSPKVPRLAPAGARACGITECHRHPPRANPYAAAERGYLDDVIAPHETRAQVVRAMRSLRGKRQNAPQRRHGNIPL